jgi:hypothetical protein
MMKFGRKKPLESQADSNQSVKDDSADIEVDNAPPEQAPSSLVDSTTTTTVTYKFGIAERLDEAVPKKSMSLQKRSPDLVPLSKDFEEMRKNLRQMIASAKKFQESMITMDKNRLQMVKEMTAFAEASPIASRIASPDQAQSVLSVYQSASSEVEKANLKFQSNVLDYCVEWEAVVSARVDKEMAASKKLRETYNHYLGKVDGLRKKVNSQESKGKGIGEAVSEKMQRNEQKLVEASTEFEAAAGPLCTLLEEVVQQGWRDLHPLIQALLKWEVDRSQTEARTFLLLQPGALEAVFNHATGVEKPPAPKDYVNKDSVNEPKSPKGKKQGINPARKHKDTV